MSRLPMPQSPYEPIALELQLPWDIDESKEKKLKKNIIRAILAVVLFIVLVQFLPVYVIDQDEPELTKTVLLLEPKELVEELEAEPEPLPPTPPKAIPKPAKTTGKSVAAQPKPQQKPTVVQSQGLDELSSQLSSLSSAVDLQKLRKKNVSSSINGTKAQNSVSRLGADQVTRRSGGVIIDDEIMRTNSAQLASREATAVDGLDLNSGTLSQSSQYGDLLSGTRDMESVRQALEAAKGRIYAEYQRALADNQDLAGKFRFQIVIEPNGSISSLSLLDSELGLAPLEQTILSQIKNVNFGAKDVITTQVEYTYVFLPG